MYLRFIPRKAIGKKTIKLTQLYQNLSEREWRTRSVSLQKIDQATVEWGGEKLVDCSRLAQLVGETSDIALAIAAQKDQIPVEVIPVADLIPTADALTDTLDRLRENFAQMNVFGKKGYVRWSELFPYKRYQGVLPLSQQVRELGVALIEAVAHESGTSIWGLTSKHFPWPKKLGIKWQGISPHRLYKYFLSMRQWVLLDLKRYGYSDCKEFLQPNETILTMFRILDIPFLEDLPEAFRSQVLAEKEKKEIVDRLLEDQVMRQEDFEKYQAGDFRDPQLKDRFAREFPCGKGKAAFIDEEIRVIDYPKGYGYVPRSQVAEELAKLDPSFTDELLDHFFDDKPLTTFTFWDLTTYEKIAHDYSLPKTQARLSQMKRPLQELKIAKQRESEAIRLRHQEETIAGLQSENAAIRLKAWEDYWRYEDISDQRAKEPLARMLQSNEIPEKNLVDLAQVLCDLDIGFADATIVEYLQAHPAYPVDQLNHLGEKLPKLPLTAAFIAEKERLTANKAEQEEIVQKERELISETIREAAVAIIEKISARLGLDIKHGVTSSATNEGFYGSVNMGTRRSMKQELKLISEQILDRVEIEEGTNIAEARERVRSLNFLVHHELAHLVQKEKNIANPKIDNYPLLDQEQTNHEANEVMLDRIAFDLARKIYVYGDGDVLFNERIRAAIAIEAHLTLSRLRLHDLEIKALTFSDENMARTIAVLYEMAASEDISPRTSQELQGLAERYKSRLPRNSEKGREIDRLIKTYRKVFSSMELTF